MDSSNMDNLCRRCRQQAVLPNQPANIPAKPFPFLNLPREIRDIITAICIPQCSTHCNCGRNLEIKFPLAGVNCQLRGEATQALQQHIWHIDNNDELDFLWWHVFIHYQSSNCSARHWMIACFSRLGHRSGGFMILRVRWIVWMFSVGAWAGYCGSLRARCLI